MQQAAAERHGWTDPCTQTWRSQKETRTNVLRLKYVSFLRSRKEHTIFVGAETGKLISGGVDDAPRTPSWVADNPSFLSALTVGVEGDSGNGL